MYSTYRGEDNLTAEEKLILARFLDRAADSLRDGYRSEERRYQFSDDPACPTESPPAGRNLTQIAAEIRSCTACALCETRTNAVPGEGAERPLVMVIGEGPGADEDATGRPFVGRAGQLLDKMLGSIGLSRNSNCFIANVIKCRPPNNRDPLPEERAACAPFLEQQIEILKPPYILCAGRIAAHTLLNTTEPIGSLRGTFAELRAAGRVIPLFTIYHPSALLRNEDLKRPTWEDLKRLRAAIAEHAALPGAGGPAERRAGTSGED
ncbi:MAG: uracil-DNA glycosylase [Treponema sp.]|nr:uracil-DNA glycosylase [Treponema sp.]